MVVMVIKSLFSKRRARLVMETANYVILSVLIIFIFSIFRNTGDIKHQENNEPPSISIRSVKRDEVSEDLQKKTVLPNEYVPPLKDSNAVGKHEVKSKESNAVEFVLSHTYDTLQQRTNEINYANDSADVMKMESKTFIPTSFPWFPPNPNFIFHNKLPKSGGSTINNIFKVLGKKNEFNYMKIESGVTTFYDRRPLVDFLHNKVESPYLLLKHHYWINFTQYDMKQPTYINVIREPVEWFTSRFYFSRYGWKRKPGCRLENCGMSKEEFEMDIDKCVAKQHYQCTNPWKYIPFFCGASAECIEINSLEQKQISLEIAKKRILNDYHVVGILEQFEDTLRMLEIMLPRYFKGAVQAWKGDFVQRKQELTRTLNKKRMSRKAEEFFRKGPLKYEIELYEFARKLFNNKLKYLNITTTTTDHPEKFDVT